MAKEARTADTAIREGVHDIEHACGTARVHVRRDMSAKELLGIIGSLVAPAGREVTADAA